MNTIKTVGIQDLPQNFKERINQRIDHYSVVFQTKIGSFDELSVSNKIIHKKDEDGNPIYEINVNLISGSIVHHAHAEEYDPVDAVNIALETVAQTISK